METPDQTPPLPEGMPCPGCGYDVGGQVVRRCSECGREITPADVARFERAIDAREMLRRVQRNTLWIGGAAAAVLGIAVGLAVWDGLAFVLISGAAAALTAGVLGVGWLAGRGVARAERPGVELAVVDSARWLLLPWVAVAPTGVALLGLRALEWLTGFGGGLDPTLGGVLTVLWLVLTLLFAPAAGSGTGRAIPAGASRLPGWAWALAMVLLWAPSAVLGGVSLAAVLIGAAGQSSWLGDLMPVLPAQP